MKKIVFLDMDGVLADFDGAIKSGVGYNPPEMFVKGFFRNLEVMPGAKDAVAALLACPFLDVYIGSKPTSDNTDSATEKMDWIKEHFPQLQKRMVLVCDKRLLRGDYLVDDDYAMWGNAFVGQFIHFDRNHPATSWLKVVETLTSQWWRS